MVVNFRTREINRDTHKLVRIHPCYQKKKKKERRGMKDLAWSKFNSTDVLWTKNRSLS
jgi:hypothetical protein